MNISLGIALCTFPLVLLIGCGPHYAYKDESFDNQSIYERSLPNPPEVVFESEKNVLVRAGYIIEKQDNGTHGLVAQKQFQEDDTNKTITISSAVSPNTNNTSSIWLIAQEMHLETDETLQTANIEALTISIPIPTGTMQTSVKSLGKTINDKAFYDGLFDAIARNTKDAELRVSAIKARDYRAAVEREKLRLAVEHEVGEETSRGQEGVKPRRQKPQKQQKQPRVEWAIAPAP